MYLTYSELEDFLAELHRVAPEKRTALKGRLKHFQRLGWPAGTNQGKGARVQYGVGQTLSLVIGFELLQLGLTPERVVEHLKHKGTFLADGFIEALTEYGPYEDAVYYVFAPESLVALRGDEGTSDPGLNSLMLSRSKIGLAFGETNFLSSRRCAFINLSDLLNIYIDYFIGRGLGSPDRLREPLENWHKVASEAADRWMSHVLEGQPHGD